MCFYLFRSRVKGDNLISSAKLLLPLDATAVIKVLTLPFESGLQLLCGGKKKRAAVTITSEVSEKANQKINKDHRRRKIGKSNNKRKADVGEGHSCKCEYKHCFFQDRNFLFSQAIRVKCKPRGVTARSCFLLRFKGAGRGEPRRAELL